MRVILYLLALVGLFTVYEYARPYIIDLYTQYELHAEKRGPDWNRPETGGWDDKDAAAKIEARKKAGKFYDIK